MDEDEVIEALAELTIPDKAITSAEERARKVLAESPHCVVCGGLITTRGKRATHHYSCEPPPDITQPAPGTLGDGLE